MYYLNNPRGGGYNYSLFLNRPRIPLFYIKFATSWCTFFKKCPELLNHIFLQDFSTYCLDLHNLYSIRRTKAFILNLHVAFFRVLWSLTCWICDVGLWTALIEMILFLLFFQRNDCPNNILMIPISRLAKHSGSSGPGCETNRFSGAMIQHGGRAL